jgi:hypothetical protein
MRRLSKLTMGLALIGLIINGIWFGDVRLVVIFGTSFALGFLGLWSHSYVAYIKAQAAEIERRQKERAGRCPPHKWGINENNGKMQCEWCSRFVGYQ